MKQAYKRLGLGALILSLVLGLTACGAHHGHRHGPDQERILKKVTRKLELNESQQRKLSDLLHAAAQFREQLVAERAEFGATLMTELSHPEIDQAQINHHFKLIESEFSSFSERLVEQYASFHASLDDSQRQKLLKTAQRMAKHSRP